MTSIVQQNCQIIELLTKIDLGTRMSCFGSDYKRQNIFAHFTRKKHLQANYWLKTYQEQQEDNSTDDICYLQGCQPWTYSKLILRIDRGGMVDNVITHSTWRHLNLKYSPIVTNLRWAKTCEKDVLPCNIRPDWLTSRQSHYCHGIPEVFMRKRSMLTLKQL